MPKKQWTGFRPSGQQWTKSPGFLPVSYLFSVLVQESFHIEVISGLMRHTKSEMNNLSSIQFSL